MAEYPNKVLAGVVVEAAPAAAAGLGDCGGGRPGEEVGEVEGGGGGVGGTRGEGRGLQLQPSEGGGWNRTSLGRGIIFSRILGGFFYTNFLICANFTYR